MPFLHDPSEVGTDPQVRESEAPPDRYRTTPLRALLAHPPYFHDGSAKDLPAVVEHYDQAVRAEADGRSEDSISSSS